jgi:hypothetical protein
MFSFGEIDENIEIRRTYTANYNQRQELELFADEANFHLADTGLQTLMVPVCYDARKTGQEKTRDYPIIIGDFIAERYQIERTIASTNFSTVVQCFDTSLERNVCIKIIHNQKETLDQGLDEIKVMRLLEGKCLDGDLGTKHVVNLQNFFYFREHLFIVFELLGENLYVISTKANTNHLLKGDHLKPIAR